MCAYFSKGRQEGISEQSLNVVREWPCDGLGEELFWQRELQRQKFWGYKQVWWKRKQVWLDGVPNEGKSNGLKNGWRWNDTEVGSLRASLQRIWILIGAWRETLGRGAVERSGCHDLMCILKRLLCLPCCEKASMEAAFWGERRVVAVEERGETGLRSLCRKGQPVLMMD